MHDRDDSPGTPSAATHVCPYCGQVSAAVPETCPQCQMRDTPETRAATTARLGPWYVLQPKNPASPGMNFSTLLALVRRGRVTPTSVVRGPTTQQLWTMASQVKGLSREFGVCYSCGQGMERSTNLCPHCQRLQDPPMNPDALLEHKPTGAAPPPPTPSNRPPHRPRRPGATGVAPPASPEPDVGLPPGTLGTLPDPKKGRILTPRELAAAFALTPPGEQGAATATASPPATEEKRRGHPVRKVLLTAVLFALVGLAAYLVIDPEFREQVRVRLVRAGDWTRSQLSKPATSHSARPAPVVPVDNQMPVQAAHREAATVAPAASTKPAKAVAPAATRPVVKPAPATVRVDVGPPVEVATPPVVQQQVKPTVEPREPAVASQEAVAKAIGLFRQALEAESGGDYARAVELYEEIKRLPKETWPATLERRLASARGRAGE